MAAPAVAVLGALAASPQVQDLASTAPSATPASADHPISAHLTAAVRPAHLDAAVRPAAQAARTYTVHTGDTLSGISQRFYGHANDWPWLYHINRSKISNPDLIYTGQVLSAPTDPPASASSFAYQPKHAKAVTASAPLASSPSSSNSASSSDSANAAGTSGAASSVTSQTAVTSSGHACSGTAASGMLPANYATIVSFLTSHGYTGIAAAGIAGNIWQESGGNPESVGSGGGGLIGWTPLQPGLVTGNPAADLQTQLQGILTFNQQWAQYIPALNAATTPAQAADIYVTDFERAGIPAFSNREAAAQAVATACGI
jgi:LysM repeat protein